MPGVETIELEELQEDDTYGHHLVVYNDDVNTFDHVIECFVKHLGHTPQQAEQCAYIIHYSGKCSVKRGPLEELMVYRDILCQELLSAEVESA